MWHKNRVDGPSEVIFEMLTAVDEAGFGCAIADITESKAHFHNRTVETYTLISGELQVFIGGSVYVLQRPGECIRIPTGLAHHAKSMGDSAARVLVTSLPAWSPDDHFLCEK